MLLINAKIGAARHFFDLCFFQFYKNINVYIFFINIIPTVSNAKRKLSFNATFLIDSSRFVGVNVISFIIYVNPR